MNKTAFHKKTMPTTQPGRHVDHVHCIGTLPALTVTMPDRDGMRKYVPQARDLSVTLGGFSTKARELDQFYTLPRLAKRFYRIFLKHFDPANYQMVEPCAGWGAFYTLLPPGSLGCDVEPMTEGIFVADFLSLGINSAKPIAVIGNPPFGKSANLAISFFNHSASQCDVIAFILPKTFRKASIINRLDEAFHLLCEAPVPDKAFLFQGKPRSVPSVFQIWVRRSTARAKLPEETTHPDFEFTTWDRADFGMQRVGKDAGRVHHEFWRSDKAHYFIKGDVEDIMRDLKPKFAAVAKNTAGNPSLAMTEIVAIYRARISSNLKKIR